MIRLLTEDDWPAALDLCALKTKKKPIVPKRYLKLPCIAVGVFDPNLTTFMLASQVEDSWIVDYLVGNIKNGVDCLDFCMKFYAERGATKMYYVGSIQNVERFKPSLLADKLAETHYLNRVVELKTGEKIADPWIARHIMHGFAPTQDMIVEFIPLSQKP